MSVAYIGPKSRTERPRKTKIGTEIAHVTCDSDTTFKVKTKRSKVMVTRPLWLALLAGQHGHRVSDRSICVYDVYRVTTCRPVRGHCGGLPRTARLIFISFLFASVTFTFSLPYITDMLVSFSATWNVESVQRKYS